MLNEQAISLVRAGFKTVLAAEDGPERLSSAFYAHLFTEQPEFRSFFPAGMDQQRDRFVRAIGYVVDNLEKPDRFVPFLEQLGRDHRKYGLVGAHFLAGANALLAAFQNFAGGDLWTDADSLAWGQLLALVSTTMATAADAEDVPAYWGATVVEHHRVLDDLAIIRLKADAEIPYYPGQYMSVQIPQRPRMWRYLSPAIPANQHGEIEFHVRRVSGGWVSPAMVTETSVGDRWAISPPLGGLRIDRECHEDVLMIAGGTGLAPMRAQIMDMAMRTNNPRVHLFIGGTYPRDLYDVQTLWQLSITNPWLTVVPVTQEETDPWWHDGPPLQLPSGMHHCLHGSLGKVVSQFGSWADRQIQISGSPSMVRMTMYALRKMGTPTDNITHDPF